MSEQKNTSYYINFLNNHPACVANYCPDIFTSGAFWIQNCSKENKTELDPIYVKRNDAKFKKFENRFKKTDDHILVSYKEYYNKNWKYSHTLYNCDLTIKIYDGKFTNDLKDAYNYKNWMSYQGIIENGKTFDEMIENIYLKVIKNFGYFQFDSINLLTPKEILNHKKVNQYIKDPLFDKTGNNRYSLILNKEYFNVTNPIQNRRWLKWFITTDFYKNNWGNELDLLVKNTPSWVWDLSTKETNNEI